MGFADYLFIMGNNRHDVKIMVGMELQQFHEVDRNLNPLKSVLSTL